MTIKKTILALAALLTLVALGAGTGLFGAEVTLAFDHFYDTAELHKSLQALQQAYPQFVTITSIGKSYLGNDIWAVILNNPKTGPAERKAGYYMDGNIHGNEIQGTEVALYTVYYLLKNYGRTEFATRLLDERAFYIVPTVNPDSRDYFLHKATDSNSPRSGLRPYDEDHDGLADEDGPDDLDGDGSITMMRKKDPRGNLKTDPTDPRLMVPVKPGEKGEYVLLGEEGIDNDGDGLVNEDGPGGYDMNRNFGWNWQPDYVQRGAGDYPFCFEETKAIADFIVAHPNIAGVQSFHNFGGMILRGPGAKNLGEYNPLDRRVYDFIGKQGEKILPGYRYVTVYKDMYTVYGGTLDFTYMDFGIFTFSNELDLDPGTTEAVDKAKKGAEEEQDVMSRVFGGQQNMTYYDNVLMGAEYTNWKPYKHPLYGDIEIGGIKKLGNRVPPTFRLAETCHRNAAFCLYHADQMPRLSIDEVKVKPLGGGLYQVDVAVANSRMTPSMSAQAAQKKLYRPDRLTVEGGELLTAGTIVDEFQNLTQKVETNKKNFVGIENGVPGFGRVELRLLVKGLDKVNLVFESLKGGVASKSVTLK
jgi:hypothetical protein